MAMDATQCLFFCVLIPFPLPHPMHYYRFPLPPDSHSSPVLFLFSSLSSALTKGPDLQAGNNTFQFLCLSSSSISLLSGLPSVPTPPGTHLSWWMSLSTHTGLP